MRIFADTVGAKNYEFSNHLGNVLVTLSDKKMLVGANYCAIVTQAGFYYPFGWEIPTLQYEGAYRYGFNGKENDAETKSQDYGFRLYFPRVSRFFSVDPIASQYPELTPYQFASNSPVAGVDMDGLEFYLSIKQDVAIVATPFVPEWRKAREDRVLLLMGFFGGASLSRTFFSKYAWSAVGIDFSLQYGVGYAKKRDFLKAFGEIDYLDGVIAGSFQRAPLGWAGRILFQASADIKLDGLSFVGGNKKPSDFLMDMGFGVLGESSAGFFKAAGAWDYHKTMKGNLKNMTLRDAALTSTGSTVGYSFKGLETGIDYGLKTTNDVAKDKFNGNESTKSPTANTMRGVWDWVPKPSDSTRGAAGSAWDMVPKQSDSTRGTAGSTWERIK